MLKALAFQGLERAITYDKPFSSDTVHDFLVKWAHEKKPWFYYFLGRIFEHGLSRQGKSYTKAAWYYAKACGYAQYDSTPFSLGARAEEALAEVNRLQALSETQGLFSLLWPCLPLGSRGA